MSEPPSDRTRLRRKPARGHHDRATIDAILDEALVCHVAFAAPHGPMVVPTTHVRVDDRLYVHGSAASAMLRTLAGGVDVAVAVTLLDGLVLAKTAFHHSVNYRSVIVFARANLVEDPHAKRAALLSLIEKIEPGRSRACRAPDDKELAATSVLALPIAAGWSSCPRASRRRGSSAPASRIAGATRRGTGPCTPTSATRPP